MPISTPTQITVPFATSGLKNAIPAASDPVNGKAGYDQGFTAINMTAKTAGGIPPFGQDFNGIFFDISTALQFLEAGGAFPYNSTFATAVGGYPLGALVSRTDGTGLWRNTIPNNTTDPETFGAGWQPESAGLSSIAMSNANVTLTALQAARSIIVITGTLTANLNLIFPTYRNTWTVINNATGAFSVTCKTAAGGGVPLPTGRTASLYGDGTNISISSSTNLARFTASGSFTVPSGVTTVWVSGCGGGGGGGGGANAAGASSGGGGGGGGGAGQAVIKTPIAVTPGQIITVTIGASGAGGTTGSPNGGVGGSGSSTTFGALLTLAGGGGGGGGTNGVGGSAAGGYGGTGSPNGAYGNDTTPGTAGGSGGFGASGPFGGGGGNGRGGTSGGIAGSAAAGAGAGGGGGGGSWSTATGAGSVGGAGSPGYLEVTY